MKRMSLALVMVVMIALPVSGTWAKKKQEPIRAPAGTNIPGLGLLVDASYDPRLDTLSPGYKIINVAIVNQSFNIIPMNPEKDEWVVILAGEKRGIKALHNLRTQDPKAWSQLPERVRQNVDYPLYLPIGGQEVIDLFVPDSFDLQSFVELDITFGSGGLKLEILVRG